MHTLTSEGISIAYWTEGNGPPIVWLQGLNADHSAFAAQVAAFKETHQCITIDNRDAGRSGHACGPYTTTTMAGDVLAVLDATAVGRAHVVGLSLGGAVAQEVALLAPERVRSITLASCFARPDNRLRELLAAWKAIYPKLTPAEFALQAWPWLFTWRYFELPNNARGLRNYADRNPTPQTAAAFARQVDASLAHDSRERLRALRVPVLVIAGAEDALVPPYLVRELAEHIPGSRYAELAGVGHSVNIEGRREFNALVRDFMAAH